MQNTSELFKSLISNGSRNTSTVISFGIFDVTAKDDAACSASGSQSFTNITSITDNSNQVVYNFATFEDDYFALDGSFYLMPNDVNSNDGMGWWSQVISDANRVFTVPPQITILFDDLHSSLGIGIAFDSLGGTYCTDFLVEWYNGTTLLNSSTIIGNALFECFINQPITNFNKIVITLQKTNLPYRYARIVDINFGLQELFTDDEIISARITEEFDPSCNTLTINNLNVTVLNTDQKFNMLNPQGLFAYLQKRQPITAKCGLLMPGGNYEYVKMGQFYLSDWKNSTGMTATLEATDAIGLLDKTIYYSSPFWSSATVQTVITHILSDAGNFQVTVSSDFNTETITGYIPIMSHREALQLLLMSIRGCLISDRDGNLKVVRPDYTTVESVIDNNLIIGNSVIEQKPFITAVDVKDYTYVLKASSEQVYNETFNFIGTQKVVAKYSSGPISPATATVSLTGQGVISGTVTYGTTCAILTIIGTGTMTLTITAKVYTESSKVMTAKLGILPAGEMPQTVQCADNKLVSGKGQIIAQFILDYFQKRIKQTFDYWENPSLQAGDTVQVETMFGIDKIGIIEGKDITLSPSLKSKMEVVG